MEVKIESIRSFKLTNVKSGLADSIRIDGYFRAKPGTVYKQVLMDNGVIVLIPQDLYEKEGLNCLK